MKFSIWQRVVAGLLLAALAGCSGPTSPSTADQGTEGSAAGGGKTYRIAVIPKGLNHEFWKSIHAGARKAARELGNVEIIWVGPQKENDRAQQISVVETFAQGNADAIVLAPLDRESLVSPVHMAMSNKIPVVIIDSGLDSDNIVSYIATDNYNGGVIGARHLGKLLDGKGNVVLLRYQRGSESTEQREKGFMDTLEKEFPQIKILSDELYSGATRPEALAKAETLVNLYGEQIDGWFCPCEPVTFGTHQALKQRGLVKKVKVVGFDAVAEIVEALRNEEIDGLVLQDPINMGYLGVKTAVDALQGKEVPKRIPTGEHLVTKENMDEPAMQDLHSPDLARWFSGD